MGLPFAVQHSQPQNSRAGSAMNAQVMTPSNCVCFHPFSFYDQTHGLISPIDEVFTLSGCLPHDRINSCNLKFLNMRSLVTLRTVFQNLHLLFQELNEFEKQMEICIRTPSF